MLELDQTKVQSQELGPNQEIITLAPLPPGYGMTFGNAFRRILLSSLPGAGGYDRPVPPPDVTPIGSIHQPGKATVEGRVRVVEIRSVERNSVLACEICDSTGDLTALFYGRSRIAGLMCGSRVRFRGQVGIKGGAPVMVNPAYELIGPHVAADSGQE